MMGRWACLAILAASLIGAAFAVAQDPAVQPAPTFTTLTPPPPPPPTPFIVESAPVIESGNFASRAGWFFQSEIDILWPRITNLRSDRRSDFSFVRRVGQADLDATAAGSFGVGYRFEDAGAILFNFYGFSSTGREERSAPGHLLAPPSFIAGVYGDLAAMSMLPVVTTFGQGERSLHTRFEASRFDIDYLSRQLNVSEALSFNWTLGLRFASVFTELTAIDSFPIQMSFVSPLAIFPPIMIPLPPIPVTTGQRARTHIGAIGAHLGVNGAWNIGCSGLALFGGVDGGLLAAGARQRYRFATFDPVYFEEPEIQASGPGVMTTLEARAGLQYTIPLRRTWLRLSGGYVFEHWWFDATGQDASRNAIFGGLDWLSHGMFLRGELRF